MSITGVNSRANPTYPVYANTKEVTNSFSDFLKAYSAEKAASAQVIEYYANADEVKAIEDVTEEKASNGPRYDLTEEEIEYFREKYGENYDKETVSDFFYELADKGIISVFDASDATCCMWVRRVEIIGAPPGVDPMEWAACPPGADPVKWAETHKFQTKMGPVLYMKHRDILAKEYDDFRKDHTDDVITWEDFIQEQRDFYEYMKTRDTIYDAEGNQRPNDPLKGYDERLECLERAAGIIKRIFG